MNLYERDGICDGRIREEWRPMPPQLRAVLEDAAARGRVVAGQRVAGRWRNVIRDLRVACELAGVAPVIGPRGKPHWVSPNDLRRTGATWLAEALLRAGSGPDRSGVEVVADWLGHRGIDVARRIYDRATGARLERATQALAGLLVPITQDLRGPRKPPKMAPRPVSQVATDDEKKGGPHR